MAPKARLTHLMLGQIESCHLCFVRQCKHRQSEEQEKGNLPMYRFFDQVMMTP